MKRLILCTFVIFCTNLFAGLETDDPARSTLGISGQMFTITFDPKAKRLTVSLVGEPVVSLAPNRFVIRARQFPLEGQPRSLDIEPSYGFFQILDAIEPGAPIEIEVKDQLNQNSEKFKLELMVRP